MITFLDKLSLDINMSEDSGRDFYKIFYNERFFVANNDFPRILLINNFD